MNNIEIQNPSAATGLSFLPNAVDDDVGRLCRYQSPRRRAYPLRCLSAMVYGRKSMLQERLSILLTPIGRPLPFDAHVSGADAKTKLTALNKKRLLLVSDIEMLEVAILEASRRVADAERAEELVADGQRASRAAEIAMDLVGAKVTKFHIAPTVRPLEVVFGHAFDERLTSERSFE